MQSTTKVWEKKGTFYISEYNQYTDIVEFAIDFLKAQQKLNQIEQQLSSLQEAKTNVKNLVKTWEACIKGISPVKVRKIKQENEQVYNFLIQLIPDLALPTKDEENGDQRED